jgi:ribosome-binding ATPase
LRGGSGLAMFYLYRLDERFGWMYARIQTWFPFHIQIGLSGREWLARQMSDAELKFRQVDNCFTWIEDFPRAQQMMNQQLETDWVEALKAFAQQLNPLHEEILAQYPTEYYWTLLDLFSK